jgi:lipopolysaccharide/colanic/teichoic acid biosynthesis glycosyltransferase
MTASAPTRAPLPAPGDSAPQTFYARFGKRFFDASFSLFGLLLLSPLLALIAAAVKLTSPGPALFSQARTGLAGKPFPILKFRTMRVSAPNSGPLLTAAGDPRITPLGRWLRRTKVDELPQLFNVLAGHMSLVGPRPEVPRYTALYSPPQRKVFLARPGITGPSIILNEEQLMAAQPDKEQFYLAAILPAKLRVDLAYCANIRFSADIRCLFLTFARLFRRPAPSSSPSSDIVHLAALPPGASGGSL